MYLLVSIVAFVVLLMILVGIHELGHFASARLFGIRVTEFGFGFPPRLWGRRRGETLYSINAIPLGGFVRMEGENGEIAGPSSFGAKPAWQRAVVLCAGAAMNFLGALVLFFLVFTIAPIPRDVPQVGLIQPGSPAAAVLRLGDLITAVNGQSVTTQAEVHDLVDCHPGVPAVLTIDRQGATITRVVVPRVHPPAGEGRVGFAGSVDYHGMDAWGAVQTTLQQPVQFVRSVAQAFGKQACGPATGGVTGPVGIARVTGSAANAVPQLGLGPVLYLAALISMNLAFVNLIPFPALDGGRLLFVLIGAVRRRRIRPEIEGLIHLLGMAVLLTFILIVTGHDVTQWLHGQ